MTRKIALRVASALVVALLGLGSPLLACERHEKSGAEKMGDKAKRARNARARGDEGRGRRREGAVKDAGAAVKEEAESAKQKAK